MAKLEQFEFNTVCRTCLSSANLKSLYDKNSPENNYADMLMLCTPVEYNENDGLPLQICTDCTNELKRSHTFALKCRESDAQLRNYIEKLVPQEYAQPNCYEPARSLKEPLAISELQNEMDQDLDFIKTEFDVKGEPDMVDPIRFHEFTDIIKVESDSEAEDTQTHPDVSMLQVQGIFAEPNQRQHEKAHKSTQKPIGRGSGRLYHEEWFYKFGVIEKNSKAFCIMCNNTVVTRTFNVKRHFQSTHKNLVSLTTDERSVLFTQKLVQYREQPRKRDHLESSAATKQRSDQILLKKKLKVINKPAGSGRQYHAEWYSKFGVVERSGKAFCIMCNKTVVSRSFNVRRHYESHHKNLMTLTNDEKILHFSQLQQLATKFTNSSSEQNWKFD